MRFGFPLAKTLASFAALASLYRLLTIFTEFLLDLLSHPRRELPALPSLLFHYCLCLLIQLDAGNEDCWPVFWHTVLLVLLVFMCLGSSLVCLACLIYRQDMQNCGHSYNTRKKSISGIAGIRKVLLRTISNFHLYYSSDPGKYTRNTRYIFIIYNVILTILLL